MAKKRLNRKVALIGLLIFVFLVLCAIGVILHLSQGPEKFIEDGDAAWHAKDYENAERSYLKARSRAKTDSLRVEILSKLIDVFLETEKWNNVLGCWNAIIKIEPKNAKARYGRLKYVYIIADNGASGYWREVASQASEFIEVADAELLDEDTAQLESFATRGKAIAKRIGPYLYLLRGRAGLEITRMGAVTDPDESLDRAIGDLEKVRELEPNNVDAYWYLAQATITKGEILAARGNLEERDKAVERAIECLEESVKAAGSDARAHINLLSMKLHQLAVQRSSSKQIQSLEPEYLSLVEKFPSSAQAHLVLAGFYMRLGPKNLDKAIEAAEKALELDKENVAYAISAANLYYRKFSIYGQKPELYKAIELAQNALTLPDAQEKSGPRRWANRMNRIVLHRFLANRSIEQVLWYAETKTESEIQKWIKQAGQAVYEIEQLLGSGEDPRVIKWQGMLELAKGNTNTATSQLYSAYGQLKASGKRDAQLAYTLAKLFENTIELGAAAGFFRSALSIEDRSLPDKIDETKPEAFLDYANVLLKINTYNEALGVVNFFESQYWPNERSQALRIKIYISANYLDEAEKELAKAEKTDDPDTIKLNLQLVRAKISQLQRAITQKQMRESLDPALQEVLSVEEKLQQGGDVESRATELMRIELRGYHDALAKLVDKLLEVEPNSVEQASLTSVFNNYIAEGQIEQARAMVNRCLEHFPDSITVAFYERMLSEPEPGKINQQRRREIRKEILSGIADPIRRAMNLGVFYQRNDELDKAAEEFNNIYQNAYHASLTDSNMTGEERLATDRLFHVALGRKDWKLAEQTVGVARYGNIDDCEGNFFAARLAMAKGEYEVALARIGECLKQRPVCSHAYMLRSNANAALGNEHVSIADAQKAATLNPLDGPIAKVLANVLYQRNLRLGDNVSPNQIIEAKRVLLRAARLNPEEWRLQSLYAEYVSMEKPIYALAIRQRLQKDFPSVENAVLLGRMAMRIALAETDAERRKALFDTAASAFEQGRAIDPQDKNVLNNYAEYYRVTGQREKAEELLAKSQDKKLLYLHYFKAGRLADAKRIMEQLYNADMRNAEVVKGLLSVAEKTADDKAVKKYSEELLSLEDSIENHLLQIQTFLKVGLVKEAEYKLQSFREKYPDEPRAQLLNAWLVMKLGQLEKALELTNQSLGGNPDNAMAWRLKGEINLLMADYAQAVINLRRSKSLSDEATTRLSLARAYLRAGRGDDAVTELKNMIDQQRASIESRMLLEQVYWKLGRKEVLKKFYDQTLDELPDSVYWHNRVAAFALQQGNLDRAEKLYKQGWQNRNKAEKAGADEALSGYLKTLLLAEKLDKVFEEAQKHVDGDLAPIAFIAMAEAKVKLDDKADAIQYCRKALKKAQTNEGSLSWVLQRMHSLLGAEDVLKNCREILDENPDSLAANFTMYNLMRINGKYNKAVGYIDKCLQIAGPDSPRRIDYTIRKVGVLQSAYDRTSDNSYLKRAIVEYESLLDKMPNNTRVSNNLAYMLAENDERLGQALKYAKRAYQAMPNEPGVLDTYAYVLYKNGKYSEAAEFLQAALQQFERNEISAPADVYKHLGMIKEEVGDRAQALLAYKQALEIGADELSEKVKEQIKKAIERLSQ